MQGVRERAGLFVQSFPLYKPRGLERLPMSYYKNRNVLQLVATTLVNNGVSRDIINATLQKVVDADRDDTIFRATERANRRAAQLIESLDNGIDYDIEMRNTDHRTFVDPSERVDNNNAVVPANTIPRTYGYESGPISEWSATRNDPFVYEGVKYYRQDAVNVVREHNRQFGR